MPISGRLHSAHSCTISIYSAFRTVTCWTWNPTRQAHCPDLGARMGRAMGLSADAVQIIALHHERWDGTGYPFGLREDRTPLLARIVGIAEVFDDLTAEKPERTSLPVQ